MAAFTAGETWTLRADPAGEMRLVIGAILHGATSVACCAVWNAAATGADGHAVRATIPFIALSLDALAATVATLAEAAPLPDEFASHFEAWRADSKGLSVFTVPFEGSLDRLIARQMAAIAGLTP
jgi:hypothetical protein